jgi:hypothetical protein
MQIGWHITGFTLLADDASNLEVEVLESYQKK